MKREYLEEEKNLIRWIKKQRCSGVPERFLPALRTSKKRPASKPMNYPLLSKTFGRPPKQANRSFTRSELAVLKKNEMKVHKFKWEQDDEQIERIKQVSELYEKGFRWWEIGQLLPVKPPEEHNKLESAIIEEMKTAHHQCYWTDAEWKILYSHSVSQNALKPTQW